GRPNRPTPFPAAKVVSAEAAQPFTTDNSCWPSGQEGLQCRRVSCRSDPIPVADSAHSVSVAMRFLLPPFSERPSALPPPDRLTTPERRRCHKPGAHREMQASTGIHQAQRRNCLALQQSYRNGEECKAP